MSWDPLDAQVEHVGRGWAFPVALSPAGGFRLVTGAAELDGSIRMILGTAPGERLLRPDFGCAMWEQTFAPLNASTIGRVEQAVRRSIDRWEPRVELERVGVRPEPEEARLVITLDYRVRATNDHRNLVYPFYVIPRQQVAGDHAVGGALVQEPTP